MRALKTSLVVMLVALGFLAGYFAGWRVHGDNVVRLSPSQQNSAAEAAKLEQRILEELQGRYYKPVDVNNLNTTGINAMLKSLHDKYTVYLDPAAATALEQDIRGQYSGIGAALEKTKEGLKITHVFPGSPAAKAGIALGDVIVKVDGQPTNNVDIQTSISNIKGAPGSTVKLTVKKTGQPGTVDLAVVRQNIKLPLTHSRLIKDGPDQVGYVYLSEFSQGAGEQVRTAVEKLQQKGADWIILDLRFDGGGLLDEAVNVAGDFMKGKVVSTQGLHSPLKVYTTRGKPATSLPMVMLVDQYTASASEIVTGALKDTGRAEIIGTRTYGKGVVQTILPLGNGGIFKLTTATYYTPNGSNINKIGIVPDIHAADNTKTKKDEPLQRALLYIRTH